MDKKKGRWVRLYEDGEPVVEQHQIGVVCSKCMMLLKGELSGPDICPNCKTEMESRKCNPMMEKHSRCITTVGVAENWNLPHTCKLILQEK